MTRLVLLIMAWFVAATVAPLQTPIAAVGLVDPFPAHLSVSSRDAPTSPDSSPDSSAEILADEIEREDDFKAFDLPLGPTREVHPPALISFAHQFSHPPSQPTPRTFSPRFRF